MHQVKRGEFSYFIFESFSEEQHLCHGCFTKEHDFATKEGLMTKIVRAWGLEGGACGKQVHGTNIAMIKNTSNGIYKIPDTDGLITNQKGVALFILHADCQPAFFYDPKRLVIAAVHCGWRGSCQNIYQKTLKCLQNAYNCDPADLKVCIGPSLGPKAAEFVNYRKELPKQFLPFQYSPNYFDFWEISRHQLLQLGVLQKHLQLSKLCTFSNPQKFFSYRRTKTSSRLGSFIALN
jgi:hypothetical protein